MIVSARGESEVDTRPQYELFLSHSHADADLVLRIAEQLDELGIAVFLDQWELAPGRGPDALADALANSGAIAVFLSGNSVGRWHVEEAYQALVRAIEMNTSAFFVWLPGADPKKPPPDMPAWLLARTRVVVRELPGGGLDDQALGLLVAGARQLTPRTAQTWLAQRRAAARGG